MISSRPSKKLFTKMELSIKAFTNLESEPVKVFTFSPTKTPTWVNGKMIDFTGMGSICMRTAKNSKENSKKVWKKVGVLTFIKAEPPTKASGRTTEKAEPALTFIPINKSTQEDGLMVKSMDMGCMNIKTETSMTENGSKTKRMVWVCCTTKVALVTMVIGSMTRPATME